MTSNHWAQVYACVLSRFSCERLFATLWSVICQAPLSMGFSRQESWRGVPFPSPGDLPDPGIEPRSPALQADSLLSELTRTILVGVKKKGLERDLGRMVFLMKLKCCSAFFWSLFAQPPCFLLVADGVIRLAGGKGSHEGLLEVYHRGQWGTVCNDGWTDLNTYVVCRQLGFK